MRQQITHIPSYSPLSSAYLSFYLEKTRSEGYFKGVMPAERLCICIQITLT